MGPYASYTLAATWKRQNEGAVHRYEARGHVGIFTDTMGGEYIVPETASAETLFQDHRNFKLCLEPPQLESKAIM